MGDRVGYLNLSCEPSAGKHFSSSSGFPFPQDLDLMARHLICDLNMVALNYFYANFSYLHMIFQMQFLEGYLVPNSDIIRSCCALFLTSAI